MTYNDDVMLVNGDANQRAQSAPFFTMFHVVHSTILLYKRNIIFRL